MRALFNLTLLLALSSPALAQTPTGQEVNVTVSGYNYVEPSATSISIHGPKGGGEYLGTLSLSARRHWFLQGNARGLIGAASYDGWCSPYVIRPNNTSPNGWALGIGSPSPCSESGDLDWYVEGRALIGKDLIRNRWTWALYSGVGVRHLSNGITGTNGFRTDNYLYIPVGLTARTPASRHALAFNGEFDALVRGWQTTRSSRLGGGDIPATPIAPAFTINGFSDVSFVQHGGWALRASAAYHVTPRWSVEPYYLYWHVRPSPVEFEDATFTVNGIRARQQLGFYEPVNFTREFGVKLGLHF